MEATMTKIDLNNLDKSTWEPFTFEEIVFRISETVDPNKTELEIYIGLEHIDGEDIHIRRKGTPDDVNGQKLKCYPGDVIFGKRRAYQRKAAIVNFEGICSAHAFVLRANTEVIDPKLFPFFLHSDQFMHCAVDISVGGLSPTINWGDLKHQEFLLPPKDQQAQLAELLWAMDEVIEKEKEVNEILKDIKESELRESFKLTNSNNISKLKDLCKITSGDTAPQEDKYFANGDYPFVRMQHLNDLEKDKYPVKSDLINDYAIKEKKLKLIKAGSILLAKSGESIRSEKKAILKNDSYVVNHLAILQDYKNEILMEYLFYFFQEFKLSNLINQTTTPSISLSDLGNIKVPLISIIKQEKIIYKIQNIDNSILTSRNTVKSTQSLQKSLINQVF